MFHGREPIRPLDIRFKGTKTRENIKTLDTQQNLDNHAQLYDKTRQNFLIHFQQYRGYFDRKAKARPLEKGDFCFLLNPKITKQNDRLAIGECKWIGLYKVEQCLTHSNYLIRKVNINLTQVVHRIRLRKYIPPSKPLDIVVNKDVKFETDHEFPDATWQKQTNVIYIDDNLEWWRDWDRMKEALNLETGIRTQTTEKQNTTQERGPRKQKHAN